MADAEFVRCPAPGCQGTIKVRCDLPPGVYDCICRYAQLRLERPRNSRTPPTASPNSSPAPPAAADESDRRGRQ